MGLFCLLLNLFPVTFFRGPTLSSKPLCFYSPLYFLILSAPPWQNTQMDTSPANMAPKLIPSYSSTSCQTLFIYLHKVHSLCLAKKNWIKRKRRCGNKYVSINIFCTVLKWFLFEKGLKCSTVLLSPLHKHRKRSKGMAIKERQWFDKVNLFFCVSSLSQGIPCIENEISCLKLLCFDMKFHCTVEQFLILHTPHTTWPQRLP